MDHFEIVAREAAVSVTKSTSIALGLLENAIDVQNALICARIEEEKQILEYGRVEGSHDLDEIYILNVLGASKMLVALKDLK